MVVEVFAILDSRVGAFLKPLFAMNRQVAMRGFEDVVRDPESEIFRHKVDYTLFYLGKFNQETGEFFDLRRESVVSANEFAEKE